MRSQNLQWRVWNPLIDIRYRRIETRDENNPKSIRPCNKRRDYELEVDRLSFSSLGVQMDFANVTTIIGMPTWKISIRRFEVGAGSGP